MRGMHCDRMFFHEGCAHSTVGTSLARQRPYPGTLMPEVGMGTQPNDIDEHVGRVVSGSGGIHAGRSCAWLCGCYAPMCPPAPPLTQLF